MRTWVLANRRTENNDDVYDVLCNGVVMTTGVSYGAARRFIYENAASNDWYLEAGNNKYPGNSIDALRQLDDAAIDERITSDEWRRRAAALFGK